ncbi:MAG: hypothetical protein JOZ27_08275, partial [Caulobacteraceae bacterium]|nr:hypothetical protein [Caulobacteraceae bacterium]
MTVLGKRDGGDLLSRRAESLASRGANLSLAVSNTHGRPQLAAPATDTQRILELEQAKGLISPVLDKLIDAKMAETSPRGELARIIETAVGDVATEQDLRLSSTQRRDLVTLLLNERIASAQRRPAPQPALVAHSARTTLDETATRLHPLVMERIDSEVASRLNRAELAQQLSGIVAELLTELQIRLNQREQRDVVSLMLN